MAIYQYYLAVIPRQGVERKHGSIPNEIRVSAETGFLESNSEFYWKEVGMKSDVIVSKVDLMINRAKWSNQKTSIHWKTYTDQIDNDVDIYLDEESLTIREFCFRSDLRERDSAFLKSMIELGKKNGWLFMDIKGKLMMPDFDEIKNSILDSDAHRFMDDPFKFLENIDMQNK